MIFTIFTETNKVRLCYNCSLLLERSLGKKINTIGNNLVYVSLLKTPVRKYPEKSQVIVSRLSAVLSLDVDMIDKLVDIRSIELIDVRDRHFSHLVVSYEIS